MSVQDETLAPVSLAPASVQHVKRSERVRRLKMVQEYARQKLREEVKRHERGYQAILAKKLATTTPHISNMVNHDRGPGPRLLEALCDHWGVKPDAFVAEALGLTDPYASSRLQLLPRNVVREAVEARAKERGVPAEALETALWACASAGTTSLDADGVDALLDLALGFDRGIRLVLASASKAPG